MLHLGDAMLHLGNAETLDFIGLLRCCAWECHFRGVPGGEGSTSLKVSNSTNNKSRIDIQPIRAKPNLSDPNRTYPRLSEVYYFFSAFSGTAPTTPVSAPGRAESVTLI